MKQAILLFTLMTAMLFMACQNAETGKSESTKAVATATSEFVPPSDGLLSPEKAKIYSDASVAVLLLSQQWIERMDKSTDTQEKILILSGFESAREQVLRKVGLAGVNEFNWITESALANPANREVAEKAGIQFADK